VRRAQAAEELYLPDCHPHLFRRVTADSDDVEQDGLRRPLVLMLMRNPRQPFGQLAAAVETLPVMTAIQRN